MSKATEYNKLSDTELLSYLRNGDEKAFNEIYNRYKVILHLHAYNKLGDFKEAKIVIQNMFLQIWNNKQKLIEISNVSGYFYRIVKTMILNIIADKKISFKHEESFNKFMARDMGTSDLNAREKELAHIIEQEIDALPPKTRAVFTLSRRLNLSHSEISLRLGLEESAVKYHIKTALKVLKTKLGLVAYLIVLLGFRKPIS